MKAARLLRILGHPDPWKLTFPRLFMDLELLREDRRRERVHNANAMRACGEGVTDEAFAEFLDRTP